MTRTRRPFIASAAAMLTVVVVLPTPPFWFATTKMRVCAGLSKRAVASARWARATCSCASAASGVESSSDGTGTLYVDAADGGELGSGGGLYGSVLIHPPGWFHVKHRRANRPAATRTSREGAPSWASRAPGRPACRLRSPAHLHDRCRNVTVPV